MDYYHIRKVKWLGEISRDLLSTSTKNTLGAISTLFEIGENARDEILKALKREAPSIDELIYRMKPEIRKGSNEHNSERARVSHHLRKLKKWGLVDTEKAGKNLRIRLTKLGKVYVAGRGG